MGASLSDYPLQSEKKYFSSYLSDQKEIWSTSINRKKDIKSITDFLYFYSWMNILPKLPKRHDAMSKWGYIAKKNYISNNVKIENIY